MDFHLFTDEITIEGVKEAHMADKRIQEKYGVKYHQFWINEEAGTVFCLMEGPDKETCEQVHREAHGAVACEIVEVEGGFYDVIVNRSQIIDKGLVRHKDGSVDNANRFILVVDIIGNTSMVKGPLDIANIKLPNEARKLVLSSIEKYEGTEVKQVQDSIIGVFINADHALRCAVDLKKKFDAKKMQNPNSELDIYYRMGLSSGQPVHENKKLLEEAITSARRLCLIAEYGEIVLSRNFERLSRFYQNARDISSTRIIENNEQRFLNNFLEHTEKNLSDTNLSVNSLSSTIGVSRPQLYRKMVSITGRSPNSFIRDLKMTKALNLIKERRLNISEIALEVGYNNPSYFSKCFQEKYGVAPSQVIR